MMFSKTVAKTLSLVLGIITCGQAISAENPSIVIETMCDIETGYATENNCPREFHLEQKSEVRPLLRSDDDAPNNPDFMKGLNKLHSGTGRLLLHRFRNIAGIPSGPTSLFSESDLGLLTTSLIICPETGTSLLPDPENCTEFWQCSNGWKYHMTCPSNLWFNSDKNICDYVWNHPLIQGCADERCPVGSSELLPVDGDCTKYIECSDGYAYVLSCCSNVDETDCSVCYFDDNTRQCVSA